MTTEQIRKQFTCEVTKSPAPLDERVLRFIGSAPTEDRDGDTIAVEGWLIENYMKNPVFLWVHRYDVPPLGKCVGLMVDTAKKALVFDIKFAGTDEFGDSEHTKFCDMIYNMYKGGYMSATSVGFVGKDWVNSQRGWGRNYSKQELLELSAVPVPSNPDALIQARSKGMVSDEVFAKWFSGNGMKKFNLRIDTDEKTIHVLDSETNEVVGVVEVAEPLHEKFFGGAQTKRGAMISNVNKQQLQTAHDHIGKAMEIIGQFVKSEEGLTDLTSVGGDDALDEIKSTKETDDERVVLKLADEPRLKLAD